MTSLNAGLLIRGTGDLPCPPAMGQGTVGDAPSSGIPGVSCGKCLFISVLMLTHYYWLLRRLVEYLTVIFSLEQKDPGCSLRL